MNEKFMAASIDGVLGFREFHSHSNSYNIYYNEIKKNIEMKIVVIVKKARLS